MEEKILQPIEKPELLEQIVTLDENYRRCPLVFNADKVDPNHVCKKGEGPSYYIGKYVYNNDYELALILGRDTDTKENYFLKFLSNGYIVSVRAQEIKNGSFKNLFMLTKYGGYFGIGPYNRVSYPVIVNTYRHMLRRLDEESQLMAKNAKYAGVTLCNEWKNMQLFCYWYDCNLSSLNPEFSYELDKDILQPNVASYNKVYSPTTCCLVPHEINIAMAKLSSKRKCPELPVGVEYDHGKYGVYKASSKIGNVDTYLGTYSHVYEAFEAYRAFKENHIRELAQYFYDRNALHTHVYMMLMNVDLRNYMDYDFTSEIYNE